MRFSGMTLVEKPFRRLFLFLTPALVFALVTCRDTAALSETVTWNVDADGQWHEGGNWSTGLAPGPSDEVVIDRAAGVYTITVSTGAQYAGSISCAENLVITGGSLTVATSVQVSGLFTLEAGRLIDAVVLTTLGCRGVNGYLDGVTIEGAILIGEAASTYLYILNGLTLNGTAYVGWGGNYGRLSFTGSQTVAGAGEVVFSDNGSNSLYLQTGVLTIGPDILVHGVRGRFQGTSGFVNQGSISADVAGGLITLEGTGWRNEGLIEAVDGGTLALAGRVTTADLGDLRGAGGTVELDGILDNTGDILELDGVTGSVVLDAGTILGGTVAQGVDGARVIYQGVYGKLDGVVMDADMIIGEAASTYLNILNGLTLNGRAYVGWGGNYGRLSFTGSQTVAGTGEVVFSDNGSNSLYMQTGVLTIGPDILVHGVRGRFQGTSGFVNQGSISADVAGGLITLEGTGWRNEGLIEAVDGGTLVLAGRVTTADLGDLRGAGGTVEMDGILDNTGDILELDGVTGSVVLDAGTILGGTVAQGVDGARVIYQGVYGKLDGVVMDADMIIGEAASTYLNILNGLTLNGTAYVGWGGNYGRLSFTGSQTVAGTGEVVFSDNGSNSLYMQTGVLTIGPDILVHGVRGRFQGTSGFVNQGSISADVAGGLITLEGTGWRNEGLIEAVDGGTLALAGRVTTADLGDLRGAGGTVELDGILDNTGDILELDGVTGSVVLDAGTILGGTVAQGVDGARVIYQGVYGKLDGVVMDADMIIGEAASTYLNILNGLTLNGRAYVGWGGNYGRLSFTGSQTVAGAGEVVFSDNGSNSLYLQTGVLTIGPDLLVHGVRGKFLGSSGFVNQGTISADVAGGSITLTGSTWANGGTLESAGGIISCTAPLTNSGLIRVRRGGLVTTTMDITQTMGTTLVDSAGVLHSNLTVAIQGGELVGYGTIEGTIVNAGVVGPGASAGTLSASGDFSQTAAGTLAIELGGAEHGLFDQLAVLGAAALDGALRVDWIYNFSPAAGDTFVIMEFGTRTGTFAVEDFPDLPPGLALIADYGTASVILRVVGSELHATIHEIADVPGDEGGFVEISWYASALDDPAEPIPVTSYEVQRFEAAWELLDTVPAQGDPLYSATLATDDILTLGEPEPWSYYRILARTATPGVFYSSPSDSGYSIDDLPPPPPILVLTEDTESRVLSWSNPGVADLGVTCLYRGESPGFQADSLLVCTPDTSWTESHQFFYYYFAQAVDIHGNIGDYSNEEKYVYPSGIGDVPPPSLLLAQNCPNPFNPRTLIRFELPRELEVRLTIFGLDGKRVRTLVSGTLASGSHDYYWQGRDAAGREVAAGVYFYRLEAGGYTQTRRMVLVK